MGCLRGTCFETGMLTLHIHEISFLVETTRSSKRSFELRMAGMFLPKDPGEIWRFG